MVDLFDLEHASQVLTTFGWAFGRLPDRVHELTNEQRAFLKRAVTNLAQEGKIVCVRLTLFAQMMKSKPWIPSTLKQVGGIEGIGVTFFEETFAATTSPPKHRYHQKAARAVLKALLPESGINIRGHMRTYAELLEASGYARRPQDLEELLNILDGELRLITPTDPEGVESGEDNALSSRPGQKHYQLTHDYLVPSLGDWLTRKQKETCRGRAELRLAERAALWNAKPENQQLPSVWQYLNIRCLTERKKWNEPQQRMMRRAGRVLGLRWGAVLVVTLILGVAIQQIVSYQEAYLAERAWQIDQTRAKSLVEAVLIAPADGVPDAIENLRELREHAVPILRNRFTDTTIKMRNRLNAALALACFGQVEYDYLVSSIADAETRQCANIVVALRESEDSVEGALRRASGEAEAKQDWCEKARVAIVAMHLELPYWAQEMLKLRPNPIQRTILIDTFASWYGDVAELVPIVAETSDAAFRSGIFLAVGSLDREVATGKVNQVWEDLLLDWYRKAPDPGTHSAAGWALRQWKVPLPEIPSSDRPVNGRQWYVNNVGMTMLRIPEGKFVLLDEDWRDAKPQEVTLTRPFFLSDREVSVGLFQRFVDDADYERDKPIRWERVDTQRTLTPDYPVRQVSWFDAAKFCNWLSRRQGRTPCYEPKAASSQSSGGSSEEVWELIPTADGYRLPTEAEWEYACLDSRTGETAAYNCCRRSSSANDSACRSG